MGFNRRDQTCCFDVCSWRYTFLSLFLPRQIAECTCQPHSIIFSLAVMGCKAWYHCPKQIVNARVQSGDVSLTLVNVLFCSESTFQSGHLHALIIAANYDFVLLEETQAAGISMCVRKVWTSVCLCCMFWGVSSLNVCILHIQNCIVAKLCFKH